QTLGIQSLDDLESAARTGRIAELDGFGAKSQDSILENIALLRSFQGRRRLADAAGDANRVMAHLQSSGFTHVRLAGEMARRLNDVGRIDIVAVGSDKPEVGDLELSSSDHPDGTAWEGTLPDGVDLRIVVSDADCAGMAHFRETGPAPFVDVVLESQAAPSGSAPDEQSLFEAWGLPWIAPELRDLPGAADRLESLAAIDLITDADLKGVLHNHSTYSDGAHTLKQMSDAVRERGYQYFGICDHSQSLKVANGMSPETVARQQEEIRELNQAYASDGGPVFRVFSGVESDILADGSLDYTDEVLASFDFVVASVHVRFNMSESEATDRLITAISHPATRILGHPTGRLILKREGYPVDHRAVLEACAAHHVSVELNANPYRLDLDWRWIELARELGVLVSINPDAHAIEQIDLMTWGVAAARKGGLMASECLNAFSLDVFSSWISTEQ
ncbi:MAG: PHP domain-containing protein, partial [Bacteroidota bacterium]|nr:PHP domain-containing protein [Bacteroidota bacterium]